MGVSELFAGSSGSDIARLAIVIFGMPFIFMVVITWVLKFMVGLRSTPDHRAFLTVVPAYVIVTLVFIFGYAGAGWLQLLFPLATVPMAWLVFWWWRREFRAAWVDDVSQLPEGVGLANDDWKIGLGVLLALIVAAAIKVFLIRSA